MHMYTKTFYGGNGVVGSQVIRSSFSKQLFFVFFFRCSRAHGLSVISPMVCVV